MFLFLCIFVITFCPIFDSSLSIYFSKETSNYLLLKKKLNYFCLHYFINLNLNYYYEKLIISIWFCYVIVFGNSYSNNFDVIIKGVAHLNELSLGNLLFNKLNE
jgi:hypothetical protein